MSDYMAGQSTLSFTYDATLEIVTADMQKLGFSSSGSAALSRPDKIKVTRKGGFADVELSFDGKTMTVFGKNLNAFAKIDAAGSIDDLFDTLRSEMGLELPAADLLSSNPYELMMSNVTDSKDLGSGIIGGKECDHLAFRTTDADWQIWIAQGDKPHPCRFTITSKMMAQAPSYTIEITEWKPGGNVAAADFQIKPPADAKEVKITELSDIDEVPSLAAQGGAQ